jgi:hypothetical protein
VRTEKFSSAAFENGVVAVRGCVGCSVVPMVTVAAKARKDRVCVLFFQRKMLVVFEFLG